MATRNKDYGNQNHSNGMATNQPFSSTPHTYSPLQIEKLVVELTIKPPPKGIIHKASFNPQERATKNYNIAEALPRDPFVLLKLKVLHNFLAQTKPLLAAIRGVDPLDSSLVVSNHENRTPNIPPQLAFMIQVVVRGKNIFFTIVDEGASTCIFSLSCWKASSSPQLN